MPQDEFLPLEAIPPRVRRALLHEFQGRHPTVQEVAQISDRRWLATPDIGPSTLENIHSVLHPQPCQSDSTSRAMDDAELLTRLEAIQDDLQRIQHLLAARDGRRRVRTNPVQGNS
jgi:hypothetical protein